MKKTLSLLLACLFLLSAAPFFSTNAMVLIARDFLLSYALPTDRQIQIDISLSNAVGLSSSQFLLFYDSAVLRFVEDENAGALSCSAAQSRSLAVDVNPLDYNIGVGPDDDWKALLITLEWNSAVTVQPQPLASLLFTVHSPGEGEVLFGARNYRTVVYGAEERISPANLSAPVPVHTHTPGEPAVENHVHATCAAAGQYDEAVYCSGCGEELSRTHKNEAATGNHVDADIDGYCDVCGTRLSSRSDFYVKYHADDHAPAANKTTTVTYGTSTTLYTPGQLGFSKAGYSFAGWKVRHEETDLWYALSPAGKATFAALENGALPQGYTFLLFPQSKTVSRLVSFGTLHVYAQWERNAGIKETLLSSNASLSPAAGTYTGKAQNAAPVVKNLLGETLVKGRDYTVTVPPGRVNANVYSYVVNGIGDYQGSLTPELSDF